MTGKAIILFDGVCNLCNGFVNFIIRRDTENKFLFGSLQSHAAIDLLKQHDLPTQDLTTVILLENNHLDRESTAVLKILRKVGGPWSLLYVFMLVPRPVRDFVYQLIARHRYQLFGKKDSCMIPTPAVKARFLD